MSEDELSEAGHPVLRHIARERELEPAFGDPETIQAVSDHIERYLGPIPTVYDEIVSDLVHIDLHHVAPTKERPFVTIVTSGMSDRPMNVPPGSHEWRFAELMMCLPPDWPFDQEAWKDERNYWPFRWLKRLARLPHEYDTWLGPGHTVPNGNPPEPVASDTELSGFIVLPPINTPDGFGQLHVTDWKTIRFHMILPLHADELALKLKRGTEALLAALDREAVSEVMQPERPSAVRKRRGWWPF
jgi:hypothetical protein